MTLDRLIAVIFLLLFVVYGYHAWFAMDATLPPILQRNPVWPSTFPKALSIIGVLACLVVIFNLEKTRFDPEKQDIDYRQLRRYQLGHAIALVAFMVIYAFLLRPAGFLLATSGFLVASIWLLGERRIIPILIVSIAATGVIWYLVDQVLGIFLRPLPAFLL